MALVLALLAQTVFTAHDEGITDLAWSPDGTMVATTSMDLTAKVWDARTGECRMTLAAGDRNPDNLAVPNQLYPKGVRFFPDSKRLATFGWMARIWTLRTREAVVLETLTAASCLAISPDGAVVATGGWGVELWDGRTGERRRALEGRPAVNALAISADGRRLLSRGWINGGGAHLRSWALPEGDDPVDLAPGQPRVEHAAASPDGRRVVAAYAYRELERCMLAVWDVRDGTVKRPFVLEDLSIYEFALAPDGLSCVTGTWGGVLRSWDLEKGVEGPFPPLTLPGLADVAYSPDGRRLAVARLVKDVHALSLHDVRTGRETAAWRLNTRPGRQGWSHLKSGRIAFSPDGRRIAVALGNRELAILDVP